MLIAALVTGDPKIVYLQGNAEKSSECTYNRGKGPKGEDFFVCKCMIRPSLGVNSCSMVVDSPSGVQFAHKLVKWSNVK